MKQSVFSVGGYEAVVMRLSFACGSGDFSKGSYSPWGFFGYDAASLSFSLHK